MRHLLNLFLCFWVFIIASCEKEISTPGKLEASKGTYIGVIQLSYPPVSGDGEIKYVGYRMHPDYQDWNEIGWTNRTEWADEGHLLPTNEIIPGKSYEYRI